MNNENQKIEKILSILQNDTALTPAGVNKFLTLLVGMIKETKKDFENISAETLSNIGKAIVLIDKRHEQALDDVSTLADEKRNDMNDSFEKQIDECKELIKELRSILPGEKGDTGEKGKDGRDGENPDPQDIVPLVMAQIEIIGETGETIADKLEMLQGDKRLDASAIKNLPAFNFKGPNPGKIASITNLLAAGTNITITGTGIISDPYTLSAVNDTTATWGSITGTLSNQTDLQNALNLKANIASPTFTGTVTTPNLTISTMTLGSVLFAGAGGAVTQDNTNFFWNDTSNRLGIGTNSPSVALEVSSTNAITALRVNTENSGLSANNYSEIQLADIGNVRSYWREVRDGSGAVIFAYNDHLKFLNTSGTEAVRFTLAGNVGIGVTNPSLLLQVSTRGGMGSDGVFYWGQDLAGNSRGVLSWDTNLATISTPLNLDFITAAFTRMRINSSGNIGIGTTGPASRLHVKGSGATSSTEAFRVDNFDSGFALVVRDDYKVISRMQTIGVNYFSSTAPANGLLVEGYVGMATIDPTSPLTVYQAVNTDGIRLSKNDNASVTAGDIGTSIIMTFRAVNDYGTAIKMIAKNSTPSALDPRLGFFTEPAGSEVLASMVERMSILAGGNVGIGTTTPFAKLEIKGSGATTGTNALEIHNSTGNNYSMVVKDDGNVGIGTSSPGSRLTLTCSTAGASVDGLIVVGVDTTAGVSHLSRFYTQQLGGGIGRTLFYAASNTTGSTQGQFDILTENGGNFLMSLGPTTLGSSNTAGFYSLAGSETIRLNTNGTSFFNSGNVGIGTVTAVSKLTVKSSIGLMSSADTVRLTINGDETVNSIDTSGGTNLKLNTVGGGSMTFATNNTDIITIANAGNVGFGVTNPLAKLHVIGATLTQVLVEANTAVAASPNILLAAESNTVLTNEGSTAKNYHTLPTAVAGYTFTFIVQDVDGLRVTASAGDTINVAGLVSAAAGYTESTVIGSTITLVSINATEWIATSALGTWTTV